MQRCLKGSCLFMKLKLTFLSVANLMVLSDVVFDFDCHVKSAVR